MNLKLSLLVLLVLSLMITMMAGCQSTTLTGTELIPQGVNLIANIQISKIVNDQDFRDAYNKAEKDTDQPQTMEDALNELVEETGIDLDDFSQVLIFADTNNMEQNEYLGFIAEGSFNRTQFIDNIEKETEEEFTPSSYKNYKLYVNEKGDFAIAFLSDEILLVGYIKAVRDVIDVSNGDQNPVSGQILDTYNRLGDALVKVSFKLPEEAREALADETMSSDIPISFEPFADIDIIGFALDKQADAVSVLINPHFVNADSAQDAKDTITGAIILFKGMIQVPEVKELLGKIEVSVTDSWMTIAFEITPSEIEQMSKAF